MVIRSDSAAGQGGFGGLPKPFSTYCGRMVIVDDANVIAAAFTDPGGYLATKYLDDNFVSKLAAA